MRLTIRTLIVTAALVCGMTSSAGAQSTHAATSAARAHVDWLDGPFHGTHSYELYANGCAIYEELDLNKPESGGRSGRLSITGCVIGPDSLFHFTFRGSFVLAAPTGATLTGTAAGDVRPVDLGVTLALTLHVEHGTKQFRNLTGVIEVRSTDFFPERPALSGALDATLVR